MLAAGVLAEASSSDARELDLALAPGEGVHLLLAERVGHGHRAAQIGDAVGHRDGIGAAGMLARGRPAPVVVSPCREAIAVLVDDSGQRVREARILVDILRDTVVGIGHLREAVGSVMRPHRSRV